MPKDLVLLNDDQPAMLVRLSAACEQAGASIGGLSAFAGEGMGMVHILILEDAKVPAVLAALSHAGMTVRAARDVLLVDCEGGPGALEEVFRRLDNARIEVQEAYLATGTRLVVVVDDLDRARSALRARPAAPDPPRRA